MSDKGSSTPARSEEADEVNTQTPEEITEETGEVNAQTQDEITEEADEVNTQTQDEIGEEADEDQTQTQEEIREESSEGNNTQEENDEAEAQGNAQEINEDDDVAGNLFFPLLLMNYSFFFFLVFWRSVQSKTRLQILESTPGTLSTHNLLMFYKGDLTKKTNFTI
ncbi:hypothetical protein V6N12_063835 [Hibiscus sabdariffa]|uniref:Uncharacterized protein n=1 Tax=Hibiscus sabdariffa TaxID=183260 RepID=A0ABR2ASI8_9ROSI